MLFELPFEFKARELRPVAYAYEAGMHCLNCAKNRSGPTVSDCEDREGNPPRPEYETNGREWCATCDRIITV